MQNLPQQLLGQVCEKKGKLFFFYPHSLYYKCRESIRDVLISVRQMISVCYFQVLDKYGDIYGRERIAELLGMDLASLDVSAMTHEKKPEPDTSMFSWYDMMTTLLTLTIGIK